MGMVLVFLLLPREVVEVEFLPFLLEEVVGVDYEIPLQWVDLENQDYLDYAEGFLHLLWPLSDEEGISMLVQT